MSSEILKIEYENPPELIQNDKGVSTQGQLYSLNIPSLASDPLTITATNGMTFTWKPTDLCYKDENGMLDYIVGSAPSSLEASGLQARYKRTFPICDDIFHAEAQRIKHWTVVWDKPRDPAEYLTGNIKFGVSGIVTGTPLPEGIHDSIDTGIFQLPIPTIKDLAGNEIDGYYEVVDTNSSQQLFIWFDASFLDNAVFPVTIDPTVIVSSQSYVMSMDADSNGNIYVVIHFYTVSGIEVYKSSDQGNTWTALNFPVQLQSGHDISNALLKVDSTNKVHLVFYTDDTVIGIGIKHITYNGSWSSLYAVANGTSPAMILDINDNIHLIYTDSSYNIIYQKYSGGSWGSPTTILTLTQAKTIINSLGSIEANDIEVETQGNIHVIVSGYDGSNGYILYNKCINGSWGAWIRVDVDTSNTGTTDGKIIIKSNGEIHVVWRRGTTNFGDYFQDSIYSSGSWSHYVFGSGSSYYSYSLAKDLSDNIYLFYSLIYQGFYRIYTNSWNNPIAFGSSTGIQNICTFKIVKNGMLGFGYTDRTNDTYYPTFDKFLINSPPSVPTNLTRNNFDATDNAIFTWQFNDSDIGSHQSAYQIQILKTDGTIIKDTGKIASTLSSYTLPAGTLTNGIQYQWKVTTWDNSDVQGPWSSLSTFYTSAKPTAAIINPASDGSTVNGSFLTVQWSTSDPESEGQSAYEVKLTDAIDNILFDSGKVADVNARVLTINYTLVNNTSYKVKVTVWDAKNVQGDEVIRTFSTSFTQPATPIITTDVDNIRGSVIININNPAPTGSQPTVVGNDIYRDGIRIATGILDTYTDYAIKSNQVSTYKVVANGNNDTTAESNSINVSVNIKNAQLSLVSDPSKYVNLIYNPSREHKKQLDRALMQFAGRQDPVAEFSEYETKELPLQFNILSADDLNMLETLCDSKETLLYRDSRGRKEYCTIDGLDIKDELPFNLWTVSFTLTKVSYTEAV